jgi:hypothetical protein
VYNILYVFTFQTVLISVILTIPFQVAHVAQAGQVAPVAHLLELTNAQVQELL